ncbi:MAG: diguanylate cyclase/phosphodiesterase [Halanaerobium sp.]|nr:MAG: diguanylate cyclase/phosphodiesterase [Halanaerobium sp.]PUU87897.1 MAG: diguanylate cyclase/phosphodiesterase [Halanaerobium sp.]
MAGSIKLILFFAYPGQFSISKRVKFHLTKTVLDDFGTGYSSLGVLNDLPIHTIKLDKKFIDKINQDSDKYMVEAIIQLAHKLKMSVVAEGLETEEQVEQFQKLNCDYAQGFYYFKPLTTTEIENLLL